MLHNRQTNGQNNVHIKYILMDKRNLIKKQLNLYLKQQPRKSRILLNVADIQAYIYNYRVISLLKTYF